MGGRKVKREIKKIVIGLVCVVAVAGVTTAFYSNKSIAMENTMATKSSSVYIQELFNPADYWLPGETKQKEVKFGNKGERDQVIRFRVEMQWRDESGAVLAIETEKPVEIKWTSAFNQEWTSFQDDNGWYYYKKVLPAGEETAEVMANVVFSTKLSNDSEIEDFTHTTYRIVIHMEGLDVNSTIAYAKWGKTFTEDNGLLWDM